MGVTTLQKPFAPVYKLHSRGMSTGHQLLCLGFQTSSCSPVLNHSLQTMVINLLKMQSLLMTDSFPNQQAFAKIGVLLQYLQNSCFLHPPADLHCSLPTILKTKNNPLKVSCL